MPYLVTCYEIGSETVWIDYMIFISQEFALRTEQCSNPLKNIVL
jgi:hypothetical protein